ncbi:hypothetical protein VKT23_019742 [Stygiomarasmius scandens]|uniref:Chromatin elongation factor SPT5 n=1 Tax=Marasmiellus scandens TaxID=2682957 RepID=A0ABR1IKL9_9AGAR
MVNPFIDDQAFESDDKYNDAEIAFHAAGGEEQEEDGWYDEDDPNVHDEDCLADLNNSPSSEPQPRLQALTDRLIAHYVQDDANHRPLHEINTESPMDHGEEIEETLLRNVLYTKEKQIFWRVKCKPGSEMDLVFDIMRHGRDLVSATPVSLSRREPSLPVQSLPAEASVGSAARALQIIRQYALTQDGEPKTVADELEKVLGSEWSVEWTRLIDTAGLEPGEDDVQASEQRQSESGIVSSDFGVANDTDTARASTILSAFFVPTVNGFVYLEGHYDDIWLDWLMQRSTVLKNSHSKVWIEPVECEEIGVLLDTPVPSIPPMSWVRVTRGLYLGDVGLMFSREMRGGQRRFKVLLVPRLPRSTPENDRPPTPPPKPTHPLVLSNATSIPPASHTAQSRGKHQRSSERPPQMLFNPQTFAGELTKIAEHIYESTYDEFRYGLVVRHYDSSSLSQQDIRMDTTTRRFFGLSIDPLLKKVCLPVPDDWIFFPEEEVVAIVGLPLTDRQRINSDLPQSTFLKNGVIVDAGGQSCTVQFLDYDEFDSEGTKTRISTVNLRKRIGIGHSVEVVAGGEKGRQGLVLMSSFDTLEISESRGSESFEVHVNSCRITARRNSSVVPWLGRHVVVIYGQYRGYSGIIVDVNPPRPFYTMVDISLAQLGITVPVQHDFVVDSSSNQWLRTVLPLTTQQQNFRQPSWDVYHSPNVKTPLIDRYTGRYITATDIVHRQPPEPWINKEVLVVRGNVKGKGTVKRVERSHQYPSGLKVEVEFDYISAEHGANPHYWRDYADLRDPRTGLPLHIVYPLKREQRYWEPLARVKAVSVKNPYTTQSWQRPLSRAATTAPGAFFLGQKI